MSWLKRIFRMGDEDEVPEITQESVQIDLLPDWVDQKSNSEFEELKPKIESLLSNVSEEKRNLSKLLEDLRSAELHNPDISEREKQIMEGNRQAYISQHKQFMNFINISDDLTCKETLNFCKSFEDLLVNLAKSTAKGHAVTSQFFADHAKKINISVKSMSDSVNKVKEILDEGNVGVENFDEVHKAVNELRSKRKLMTELDEELAILNKKLENSNAMKAKLNKKIDELKQTDDYAQFRDADQEREKLWQQLKQEEDELNSLFSPVNKAMRKFERILAEDVSLFKRYIDSPVEALLEDDGLKIMAMLEKMKFKLMDGTLELKDSDKAVERIADITRDRLELLRTQYKEAKAKIKDIDHRMRQTKVLSDIDDLQYKIEHVDNQIQILQDKIDNAGKTKSKIDLDALKKDVQDRIMDAFNVEVDIRWQQEQTSTGSQSSSSE